MDIIINKEACNGCTMKCHKSPDCCCSCNIKCIGRIVCPIFSFTPEVKKRNPRMTKEIKYQKMFNDKILEE